MLAAAVLLHGKDQENVTVPSVISGRVHDAQRQPVAGARVYVIDSPVPVSDVAVLTDEDGSFSLTVPAAGTYRVGFMAEGLGTGEASVKATGGRLVPLNIELKPQP
ncbi:carboxypeptidase-like regulatory domain-containing protein [Deinococcus planocerae]|uniref:carboxypeptidase-like regulatory domain-containing protein n=1 Tax=Deinococcus planocerae TaxID=1737569 RepID=UPI0015E12A35|nr:carboxypeptidase-like regulatory domain-containing protein [Deinococcus planocerae]